MPNLAPKFGCNRTPELLKGFSASCALLSRFVQSLYNLGKYVTTNQEGDSKSDISTALSLAESKKNTAINYRTFFWIEFFNQQPDYMAAPSSSLAGDRGTCNLVAFINVWAVVCAVCRLVPRSSPAQINAPYLAMTSQRQD